MVTAHFPMVTAHFYYLMKHDPKWLPLLLMPLLLMTPITQMSSKCSNYPNEFQMHPLPKWFPNASIAQMNSKCIHYPNDSQMPPLPKWLPNDSHYPNDLWSIGFLLIYFVKKQFHIVVTFYFWSNPQYGIVRGMVLMQLNSTQLLTNNQSQNYFTSATTIWMKTIHNLCIIGGDMICAFLVIQEYATIHA